MASFGTVLDLLDDRYLELQDVIGNVEPLPTLVPYTEYKQTVLVYSMSTNLNVCMALVQELTQRRAREKSEELWTWCVQWKIEAAPSKQRLALPPSSKKPRLDAQQLKAPSKPETEECKGPFLNIVERRIINPKLLLREEMLRCLIDIVQAESRLVPNFIEFLYRWIDFYQGDGTALKAAMRWEIPSLWEFEYHPLIISMDPKQKDHHSTVPEDIEPTVLAGVMKPSTNEETNSKINNREKPDIAAFEEEIELSERLQYREVHYGIEPPHMSQPIPRLLNIPTNPGRRIKYYAACFKSRQRAFNILIEAGLTVQQITNYKRLQVESVRETPCDSKRDGLKNYEKDAKAAQAHYIEKEKEMAVRAKHTEAAISNRLALEARVAARSNVTVADPTGVPLIPATPSYTPRPAMEMDILEKLQIGRAHGGDRINIVPKPLVGRLKSTLFASVSDLESLNRQSAAGLILRRTSSLSEANGCQESYSPPQAPGMPYPRQFVTRSFDTMQASTNPGTIPQTTADGPSWNPQQIETFVDNLTPTQRQRVIQMMHQSYVTGDTNARPPTIDTPEVAASSTSISVQHPPGPMQTPPSVAIAHAHQPAMPSLSFQPPLGFERQRSMTLPIRAPMPTSYSNLAPGASQPPPQRRISSDPISLSYLRTLGSGGPMQRNNAQGPGSAQQQQQHTLAPRPLLPELPRLPSPSPLPSVSQASVHPLTPRLPPPNSVTPWNQHPHNTVSNSQHPTVSNLDPRNTSPRTGISRTSQPHALPVSANPLLALGTDRGTAQHKTPIFASTQEEISVLIYLPKVIRPGNTLGPGGVALGDNGVRETDVLLLGHSIPGSGKIVLSRAIFLPMGIWQNVCRRAQSEAWRILESYPAGLTYMGTPIAGNEKTVASHRAVYTKLELIYSIMSTSYDRESELTKRWRATRGPMTLVDRGSVWEGWGVTVDKGIELDAQEREGAVSFSGMIDEGVEQKSVDEETAKQKREIERLLAEDGDTDEDEDMET
ncbi:hypothetical protein IAQ61_000344 [Plenodomus lingam]|uniref:Predicted protein n=1 Tax=Leptosphaeria maculans (strain JN3 / isolate v23.1.3 / race Av1-4-5-6-7-8) TaxID=985895 RepID=E5R4P0_LEPMJ|nr:predicted protein [Plenodomus lingam JN3]KAH9881617.1 hypothetical protein IAQ61_000344 [Plenodomus lingam]CBX92163.1 predicted protein [Plenodomus lingam JN3]